MRRRALLDASVAIVLLASVFALAPAEATPAPRYGYADAAVFRGGDGVIHGVDRSNGSGPPPHGEQEAAPRTVVVLPPSSRTGLAGEWASAIMTVGMPAEPRGDVGIVIRGGAAPSPGSFVFDDETRCDIATIFIAVEIIDVASGLVEYSNDDGDVLTKHTINCEYEAGRLRLEDVVPSGLKEIRVANAGANPYRRLYLDYAYSGPQP